MRSINVRLPPGPKFTFFILAYHFHQYKLRYDVIRINKDSNRCVTMQTCPRCKHSNRDGEMICQNCKQMFSSYTGLATRQMRAALDFNDQPQPNFDSPAPKTEINKITVELAIRYVSRTLKQLREKD